jgi:DNA mismatch repair protein MutL
LAQADLQNIFREMFDLNEDSLDLKNNFDKSREDILATLACHSSVRAGQKLGNAECVKIIKDLLACDNKYSCPHGRPAVWKQSIQDLDKHFLRTY